MSISHYNINNQLLHFLIVFETSEADEYEYYSDDEYDDYYELLDAVSVY